MAVAELMARTTPTTITQPAPAPPPIDNNGVNVRNLHPTAAGPNTDVTREKTVIKEREVVTNGPGGKHREHETEDVIERDYATGPGHGTDITAVPGTQPGIVPGSEPGTNVLANVPVDAAGIPLPASQPSSSGGRINPRTGKPLSIPKPLSLSPHAMSPINPQSDAPGGRLIREEHEEVSQTGSGIEWWWVDNRSYRDLTEDHRHIHTLRLGLMYNLMVPQLLWAIHRTLRPSPLLRLLPPERQPPSSLVNSCPTTNRSLWATSLQCLKLTRRTKISSSTLM